MPRSLERRSPAPEELQAALRLPVPQLAARSHSCTALRRSCVSGARAVMHAIGIGGLSARAPFTPFLHHHMPQRGHGPRHKGNERNAPSLRVALQATAALSGSSMARAPQITVEAVPSVSSGLTTPPAGPVAEGVESGGIPAATVCTVSPCLLCASCTCACRAPCPITPHPPPRLPAPAAPARAHFE